MTYLQQLEQARASIIARMSSLHIMFCMPVMIVNTETSDVKLSYQWVSEKAETTYNEYATYLATINGIILAKEIEAQNGIHQRRSEFLERDLRIAENEQISR